MGDQDNCKLVRPIDSEASVRATGSSLMESDIHFYKCLAPCFTQEAFIKEGIVAERIEATYLEERRWEVGM